MSRMPDALSESRLVEIRREAENKGLVQGAGVAPAAAPFPRASEQTGYYGMPLLKQPQWKWEVPIYLFVGGLAGAAGVIAPLAEWVGNDYKLARDARWLALGGVTLSTGLLVADLGRPERFLNMLRVFKPQSPMSVGSWVLTAFGTMAGASAFAKAVQARWDWLPVRVVGNLAQAGVGALGLPLHNYTGVLVGATVVPVWNCNIKTLPLHFGASGVQAGCSALELMGHFDSPALNWLAMMANAYETYEGIHLERRRDRELVPLKKGRSGWITRAGGVLSGPVPLGLRLMAAFSSGRRARNARKWAAVAGLAGSLLTRHGWIAAGRESARNWRLPLEIPDAAAAIPQPKPEVVPEEFRQEREALG